MSSAPLVRYDAACRALAEAKAVDEVKNILDVAVAMAAYARQAKNRDLEADAVAIRMRATRRIDELRRAQAQTVGLATGGEHGGRAGIDGVRKTPSIVRPTLAMQGIGKNLAKQARVLGALSDSEFEQAVADARDAAARVFRNVVNAATIAQEREAYRARTERGGTVADLQALIQAGKQFGILAADPPQEFEVYSGKGKRRSAERRYDTWPVERIMAFGEIVQRLALPDSALFLWLTWPLMPAWNAIIGAWGFTFKTAGFTWVKTNADGSLFWGMGYASRANTEPCLLATRGAPLRLAADVHQVILASALEHSEKPDEAYLRMARLYPGPCLELFARKPREGWTTWGNEIAPPSEPEQ
jgi:N6-adenosine-specific RNA methylase IME4